MKRSENLEISKVFIDDAVKLISGNKKLLENIIVVSIDVYTHGKNSMYYRHTLTGNLKGVCDFQITGDIRLFALLETSKIKFLRIGTHSYLGI